MDEKKLAKIKAEIAACRGRLGNLKHNDLAKIARMLGRERSSTRTNEPTFESALLNTNVITIPDHSWGLNKWTAKSILGQLEEDVFKFENQLKKQSPSLSTDVIEISEDYEN